MVSFRPGIVEVLGSVVVEVVLCPVGPGRFCLLGREGWRKERWFGRWVTRRYPRKGIFFNLFLEAWKVENCVS